MPTGKIAMMTQKEANYLLRAGYKPIEWITPRQLAIFWDCAPTVIRAAASRRSYAHVEKVRISTRVYLNKADALRAWCPQGLTDEEKFDVIRRIPELIQAEIDSGVYDKVKPIPLPVGEDGKIKPYARDTAHYGTAPEYVPGTPMPEPLPQASLYVKHTKAEDVKPIRRSKNDEYRKQAELYPKRKEFEQSYLEAMANIVKLHDWEQIVVTAVNDAANGDAKARAWLSDYLIGKPITRIASIQQVKNTNLGEDERKEYLKAIFDMQLAGEEILDVKSFNEDRDGARSHGLNDSDTEEVSGRDTSTEHAVETTSEE